MGRSTRNRSTCDVPMPPENGRFACDAIGTSSLSNALTMPTGSVCRVLCDEWFQMNNEVERFSTFRCGPEGYWNSTMMDFCYPN